MGRPAAETGGLELQIDVGRGRVLMVTGDPDIAGLSSDALVWFASRAEATG
jgi:hypothetical protein